MPTPQARHVADILDTLVNTLISDQDDVAKQGGRNSVNHIRSIAEAGGAVHRYAAAIRSGDIEPEDVLFILPNSSGISFGVHPNSAAHRHLRDAYQAIELVLRPTAQRERYNQTRATLQPKEQTVFDDVIKVCAATGHDPSDVLTASSNRMHLTRAQDKAVRVALRQIGIRVGEAKR